MRSSDLLLYRNFKHGEILEEAARIMEGGFLDEGEGARIMKAFVGDLTELAVSHGYDGNIWQAYLTYLLANNENAFSTSCEMKGMAEGTVSDVALCDLARFRKSFMADFSEADRNCGTLYAQFITEHKRVEGRSGLFNSRIRDRILELRDALAAAASDEEFASLVAQFYGRYGVGKFGLHKAFRIDTSGDKAVIEPITNIAHVDLDDLVGYESAKKKLTDNTEAFIEGRPCNNCLLFGDAGTGKSSSIKGILNRYYDRGLRVIEVYKHQFRYLNDIIDMIKNRNYRFIIFMDDLSFEDFETDYKYLKAVIEGGLEKKPGNILIYATSNRRHIVREKYSDKDDRDDDLHTNDTVQEKLSLAYRFGETIFFARPDKKQFDVIVTTLAKRYGITMDEDELLLEANKWELSHGGLSGRTAVQFIDHIRGMV